MPFSDHPSFARPFVSVPLWRYMDLPKFISLLTSQQLWLTNAEVLAQDDPHEGTLSTGQFLHRQWASIDDVPLHMRAPIIQHYGKDVDFNPSRAFRLFVMEQEQVCIFAQFGRRQYYVNCWHAADHESAAMWKVYASPGPGLAVISNGARLESALVANPQSLHLGAVRYFDERRDNVDWSNAFNIIMAKRTSFAYEKEVRLVYWDTSDFHDPLENDQWNDETFRFENIIPDNRPIRPGIELNCDINILISSVIISPYAPTWYKSTIEKLRDRLGYTFAVAKSNLLDAPFQV